MKAIMLAATAALLLASRRHMRRVDRWEISYAESCYRSAESRITRRSRPRRLRPCASRVRR